MNHINSATSWKIVHSAGLIRSAILFHGKRNTHTQTEAAVLHFSSSIRKNGADNENDRWKTAEEQRTRSHKLRSSGVCRRSNTHTCVYTLASYPRLSFILSACSLLSSPLSAIHLFISRQLAFAREGENPKKLTRCNPRGVKLEYIVCCSEILMTHCWMRSQLEHIFRWIGKEKKLSLYEWKRFP